MSILLTPYVQGALCHGNTWVVQDEAGLAEQIAGVALGQSRHVAKILAGANLGPPPTTASAAHGAVQLLTAKGDPWHRDGWMFQVMSWVAAYAAAPAGVIRAPQMIQAEKGFDGLQLDLDAVSGEVRAVIIFEDKATDYPRDTITKQVWPDFKLLEAGDRENVLTAEVVALLQTVPNIDVDLAIQNIIWKNLRHYRVSITVGNTHAGESGRQQLFHDFDAIASGALAKRRAETFHVQNLRKWMAALAEKAIAVVHAKAESSV
ncbi:MAG: hypothetical protein WDO56_05520 [Gammaproteobacteria bacterium]